MAFLYKKIFIQASWDSTANMNEEHNNPGSVCTSNRVSREKEKKYFATFPSFSSRACRCTSCLAPEAEGQWSTSTVPVALSNT